MQKITPFLWFDGNAEEAMNYYTSIFKNSKITSLQRLGDDEAIFSGTFELEGQTFMALNGGPHYQLTPAFSLYVNCDSQEEVDELWEKLSAGGEIMKCGWLTDKFGVSWQIIPAVLSELMHSPDPERSARVMQAMLQMEKLDIAALKQAYETP
ncbi:putative 3-demethylubiquinone-9 3-methyltransferase (glyoxalase superfamily) [Tumebacillus sp. BK434]|uniref:VOC family protein n=1 Tax=Tumebacillus sp. BK434 TaxID=2512169 RepID=UPI001050A224|nr:VOC family protein [Tumebacillus sp. BK434]TCP58155.1 putative 3-demethylubiquinone-9 3-methyltransferase (glyoxalase superfamily) [Tumebacillus sp. BK434]